MNSHDSSLFVEADWPKPANVSTLITTRCHSGSSAAPFAQFNLATHVGDSEAAVLSHRKQLAAKVGAKLSWLQQTHSVNIACLDEKPSLQGPYDGSYTRSENLACVVMTADCLPVFLCDDRGEQVMCLHAGWRGLAEGILSRGVSLFPRGARVLAYLGPAISAEHFEVGADVRAAFQEAEKRRPYKQSVTKAFVASQQKSGKFFADLYQLARFELEGAGVVSIHGGEFCTYRQSDLFYSYRRDGITGRFASLIWRNASSDRC